jgi:hypothetical protein
VASGLTRPEFREAAPEKGVAEFRVRAVNGDGVSAQSAGARVTMDKAPMARMMPMH